MAATPPRMCVFVSVRLRAGSERKKSDQNKTNKQNRKWNHHQINRYKLYRDSDIILITRPRFHTEFLSAHVSLKGFCCYCFKWQQRGGERGGGRGGAVMLKRRLVCGGRSTSVQRAVTGGAARPIEDEHTRTQGRSHLTGCRRSRGGATRL